MAYSEKIGGPMAIVDRARAAVESLSSEVARSRSPRRRREMCSCRRTLSGHVAGQLSPHWTERQGGVAEHRTARARSRLRQRLGRQHAQREADVDASSIQVPSTTSPSTTTKRLRC